MAHVALILVKRLYLHAFRLFRHEEQADEESSSHRISRISALVFDHGLLARTDLVLHRVRVVSCLRDYFVRCLAQVQEETQRQASA